MKNTTYRKLGRRFVGSWGAPRKEWKAKAHRILRRIMKEKKGSVR